MNWNKGPSIVLQELLEFFYHANFFIFGNVLQLKNPGFSHFFKRLTEITKGFHVIGTTYIFILGTK